MRLLSFLIVVGIFTFAIFIVDGDKMIFNLPAMLMVMGIGSAAGLSGYKPGMDLQKLFPQIKKYLIYAGWLAALLSMVQGFWNFEATNTDFQLINLIGLTVVSLFWGYFLAFLVEVYCITDVVDVKDEKI